MPRKDVCYKSLICLYIFNSKVFLKSRNLHDIEKNILYIYIRILDVFHYKLYSNFL